MANAKDSGLKIKVKDNAENESVLDLVYEATSEQFILWLKQKGRRYIPYYPGLNLLPEERFKEIDILKRKGGITADLTGAGEVLEK